MQRDEDRNGAAKPEAPKNDDIDRLLEVWSPLPETRAPTPPARLQSGWRPGPGPIPTLRPATPAPRLPAPGPGRANVARPSRVIERHPGGRLGLPAAPSVETLAAQAMEPAPAGRAAPANAVAVGSAAVVAPPATPAEPPSSSAPAPGSAPPSTDADRAAAAPTIATVFGPAAAVVPPGAPEDDEDDAPLVGPSRGYSPGAVTAIAALCSFLSAGTVLLATGVVSASRQSELREPASEPPAQLAALTPASARTAAPVPRSQPRAASVARPSALPEPDDGADETEEEDDEAYAADDVEAESDDEADAGEDEAPASGEDLLDGIAGALTMDDIVEGVRTNGRNVGSCVHAAVSDGELEYDRPYTFVLDWTVKADGSVTGGRLKGPRELVDTPLADCLAVKMRTWRFKASTRAVPVTNFPFGPVRVRAPAN